MALNPSPQRQSVVTFPTPNVNDILFFETVDAERVGPDVPKYGSSHPDYKKWPNHRLVHIEAADDQTRYYRYYYAADQLEQDNDNWSYSEADIGGTKFDAVSRDYVIRRSEFSSTVPAMGAAMPDTPTGKFSGTHVLAERKQIPLNDKILNGLYVVEQRVYVKKVPLSRLDFDEFFKTTNETKQILYYGSEVVSEATVVIGGNTIQNPTIAQLEDNPDNAYVGPPANNIPYWGMNSGTIRTVQQLSDNWFAVTEQEVVKCPSEGNQKILQDEATSAINSAISGKKEANGSPSSNVLNLFSSYTAPSTLTRNTNCWAHNLKGITGFVAWNGRSTASEQKQFGGVAITPRHILFTNQKQYDDGRAARNDTQASFETGDIVYFCSRNGEIYSRRILSIEAHAGYTGNAPYEWDYAVGILDSDLPSSIEVIKVLPRDGYQYFNTSKFTGAATWSQDGSDQVLALTTDQNENAHVRRVKTLEFGSFDYENPDSSYTEFTLDDTTIVHADWNDTLEAGDLGSIAAAVIGDECVLLGLISSTSGKGAFIGSPRNFKDLNDLLTRVDAEYTAATAAQTSVANYYSDSYQLQPIDLNFNYKSYRPEEQSQVGCARLRYETVVNYAFPPILQDVQFDVWNLRSGGARTYPRVLYSKGSFRGPCKAVVDISWSTTQPVGLEAGEKPAPEPISIQNPLFTLSIPPTLHPPLYFTVSINSDETWNNTGAVYNKNATNVTTWKPHIISSEVKPFRGGWLMETVTVYPPS